MTDTPLFQATLSDVLLRARRDAERAQAKAALASRRAAERVAEIEHAARAQVVAATRRAAEASRMVADAERVANHRLAEAQVLADARIAEAERRAQALERQERVRRALIVEEVEDRIRHELAHHAPPLPVLDASVASRSIVIPTGPPAAAEDQIEAPPVPSMDDLLRPSPGVARFLDTLLGPSS